MFTLMGALALLAAALYWYRHAPPNRLRCDLVLPSTAEDGFPQTIAQIDAYLQQRERCVDDLIAGTQKYAQGQTRRPRVIFYIHGFSASRQELSPVPEQLAQALSVNYYATRLQAHGRTQGDLAEADAQCWLADAWEGWRIARLLGDQVTVIATSTSAALAVWLAQQPSVRPHLASIILVSPNFKVAHPAACLLGWFGARYWSRWLLGQHYTGTPYNAAYTRYWTYRYAVAALLPMYTLVTWLRQQPLEHCQIPALFICAKDDKVVSTQAALNAFARWGATDKQCWVLDALHSDNTHIVIGDIFAAQRTTWVVQRLAEFVLTATKTCK